MEEEVVLTPQENAIMQELEGIEHNNSINPRYLLLLFGIISEFIAFLTMDAVEGIQVMVFFMGLGITFFLLFGIYAILDALARLSLSGSPKDRWPEDKIAAK